MLDLARFVGICADAEVRRETEAENFIVEFCHEELTQRMAVSRRKPPYDIEQARPMSAVRRKKPSLPKGFR